MRRGIRTTLSLDEDVAPGLRREMHRTGRPFKAVVNELLRSALHVKRTPRSTPVFTITARPLGLRPGVDYDRIGQLLEELEDPTHR